jgi:hypothetical protein
MQCTYNVTLRGIHVTTVAVEKQYILHILRVRVCVCSLRYLACQAHVPHHIRLWSVQLYHIFPHYLINSTIFRKKLLNIKCVF